MAGVAIPPDEQSLQQNDSWGPQDDQSIGLGGNGQSVNGASLPVDDHPGLDPENQEYPRGSSVGDVSVSGTNKGDSYRGEKQVKVLTTSFLSLLLSWYIHGSFATLFEL